MSFAIQGPLVREYRPEDRDAVALLCREHGERRIRSHTKFLDGAGFGWVATQETEGMEEFVGFTAYNPNEPDMDSVTVISRTCRNVGLAQRLLEVKMKHAKAYGCHGYITTIGATNTASINLVLKMGFRLTWAEDRMYGQILRFEKELNR